MGRALAILAASLLAACGTTYSSTHGQPSDAGADTVDRPPLDLDTGFYAPPDVPAAPPPDVSPPPTDAGPGGPYPVVLVHGFAGFRDIGPINYFFNVGRDLRSRGETVFESEVAPFLPPEQRGPMLARFVDGVLRETGSARVILVAHSQGGLDARYVVSSLGYGDRVAAVVTISTPHRGTRLADLMTGAIPGITDGIINAVASVFGFTYNDARSRADLRTTLTAMSERNAETFNRQNPDDPRVRYFSWAGRSNRRDGARYCDGVVPNEPGVPDNAFTPLLPLVLFLERGDGREHVNDGLVEVRSARWGTFMGCIPADHFDEVGQIAHTRPNPESGFDHLAFYRDVVARLRRDGL